MRISSNTLRHAFLSTLQTSQRQLVDTQTRIATGRRINVPSDDPLGAARIADLDASLLRTSQYGTNAVLARNRLSLEEETLVGVAENLQRSYELAVQANNATVSDGDRAAIALELRERLDSVIALSNSVDAGGNYLFSGHRERIRPFSVTASGVVYNGDQGSRSLQIGAERFVAVNDAGSEVFQRIATGNGTFALATNVGNTGTGVLGAGSVTDPSLFTPDTYTITFTTPADYEVRDSSAALVAAGTYAQGQSLAFLGIDIELSGSPAAGDVFTVAPSTSQDIFTTLDNLIASLELARPGAAERAQLNTEVGQLMLDLSQAMEHVIGVRADIGSRLHAIDDEVALNEGVSLSLTETLSEIRDLDYAEAISLLSQQLLGLDAAQQSYTRIQGLSLFRFL